MLPFGNVSATLTINGAELKDYLETAVSRCLRNGQRPLRAGLGPLLHVRHRGAPAKRSRDRERDPGHGKSRHSSRPAGGRRSCTGCRVALDAGHSYTLTTNDFTAGGGDGYQNFRTESTTQDILDQDLADYLAAVAGRRVSPTIQRRIHCTDSNPVWATVPGRLAVDERS